MSFSFADIIVPLPLNDSFTYSIPLIMQCQAKIGMRVMVQFGQRKFYSGIIYRLHNEMPQNDFETKSIEALLDDNPIVTPKQIELWIWISQYYCCSLGEVYKAALPSGLKLESETKFAFNSSFEDIDSLNDDELLLVRFLQNEGFSNIHSINQAMGKKSCLSLLKILLDKNAVSVDEKVEQSFHAKTISFVKLSPQMNSSELVENTLNLLQRAPKQQQLFSVFLDEVNVNPEISKKHLLAISNSTDATLRELCKKNILELVDVETDRLDLDEITELKINALSNAQENAFKQINSYSCEQKPILLHGVTSSGKTEVYIKLIEQCLAQNKQALFLVPEIALTTQLVSRLKQAFGNKAGIYHSRFSDAERVEIWNKTLSNQYQVVIGARSAALLPFQQLGLIIVDEEHEQSYKQFDPAPRYHARDVAIILGIKHQAQTILGSATPSFESYFNALSGKYHLVELLQRFNNVNLPRIIIADEKEAERKKEMKSLLTPELHHAIENALEKKQQVILFQNRRGYAPYIQCSRCSWIPKCSNCDVSLTFHKDFNFLNCHYCGFKVNLHQQCPTCGHPDIRTRGIGTEKVVDEVGKLFPNARIGRMDLDTTRSKFAFQRIISDFENQELDILVGTQMVSKGLDFNNVHLVGILSADQIINFPDYRAYERAYQMLTQVSGRAGRRNEQGLVIIQSRNADHQVLQMVKDHQFAQLFNQTMVERKIFRYPPYHRLIKIVIKHRFKETLNLAAKLLADRLRPHFGINVLGPEYPLVARIQLQYQKEIWIKIARNTKIAEAKHLISSEANALKKEKNNSALTIFIDVDPM